MIQFNKTWLVVFSLVLSSLNAQQLPTDLYSLENSKKFATYLLLAQDYELATLELERLNFMLPEHDSLRELLLRTYRLSGQAEKGIKRFQDFYAAFPPAAPQRATLEYYGMILNMGNFAFAQQLVNRYPNFKTSFRENQQVGLLLQQAHYDSSSALIGHYGITDPVLLSFNKRSKELPHKSPLISGVLSTLVPGLGKIYTGNWQDGLIALVFVGSNAFGAYRGFNASGVESAYGWFFTAVGTAFYVSNIYGSVKSARVYNLKYQNALTKDVERYLHRSVN